MMTDKTAAFFEGHFPAKGDQTATNAWEPFVTWRPLSAKVIAAARTRIEGRWAAYIDAVPGKRHEEEFGLVLDSGAKLHEKIARVIFPLFDDIPYAE